MNYLLDRKEKRKKVFKIIFFILIIIVLLSFGSKISSGLSRASFFIFRPVMILKESIARHTSGITMFFRSKRSLVAENENLKNELDTMSAKVINYDAILDDNLKIMNTLGRKREADSLILSAILGKPNQSPYDTLVIDVGDREGVVAGNLVLALGSIPIGRVAEVHGASSKVVLFSSPGEKTEGVISGKDIFLQVIGRGGGNFEIILERDINLEKGTEVLLPGIDSYLLAKVESVISDPRDAFNKILLVSPVNIQELKFVQVKK